MNVTTPGYVLMPQLCRHVRGYRRHFESLPTSPDAYNGRPQAPYYLQDRQAPGYGRLPSYGNCQLSPIQDSYLGQLESADQKKANSLQNLQRMGFRKMSQEEISAYVKSRIEGIRKPGGLGDIKRFMDEQGRVQQEVNGLVAPGNELWTREDGKRVRLATDGSVSPI